MIPEGIKPSAASITPDAAADFFCKEQSNVLTNNDTYAIIKLQ